MMGAFTERFPEIISENPGGPEDPLGESILNHELPWLRIFEPTDVRIVIGRNQKPDREVLVDQAQADGIPIHRRVSGGGTVVLAPGTVVVAIRLRQEQVGVDCYFSGINKALCAGLANCAVDDAACFGYGDLAIQEDGTTKKILGASLRQSQGAVYYLGVFMLNNQLPLIERYLPMPSKQPDYRAERSHADFCTHLGKRGVGSDALQTALRHSIEEQLTAKALLD